MCKKSFKNMSIAIIYMVMLMLILAGCKSNKELNIGQYKLYANLEGGSGKAYIESPLDGEMTKDGLFATVIWSSPNYDYMIVGGKKYYPVNETGNSRFIIPVESLDSPIQVIADTVAMSKPHEIQYNITFSLNAPTPQELGEKGNSKEDSSISEWKKGLEISDTLDLKYAKLFNVSYLQDDNFLVEINKDDCYLFLNNKKRPDNIPDEVTVITLPLNSIYMVSSASVDFFDNLSAFDGVRFSSVKEMDAENPTLKELMKEGHITYAGKYSAPDYEMLLKEGCDLAVENTMITHAPDVLEKLNSIGINTIVDYSSLEETPLARMEWIKLYGLITGTRDKAFDIFNEKESLINSEISDFANSGKTVAYFYITDAGAVVVRRNQDYIARLIEMSGGKYVLSDSSDYDGTGTSSIQKESFFEEVSDCDCLIYNSTISGEIKDKSDLLDKCEMLKNTKAFKEGNVFCTRNNIYLSVMELPEIAMEINAAINGENVSEYLYRLE